MALQGFDESYAGKWQLIKHEGLDAFLEANGSGDIARPQRNMQAILQEGKHAVICFKTRFTLLVFELHHVAIYYKFSIVQLNVQGSYLS
ncbi:hypothetical protein DPMN_011076 [Dreissena polymorpha]|uniref:Uncharacterized protein n=1 Tax=Dreissena polymorpha TaxID=45954 RepID=A0A9D4N379_DREPO|nr:hypothetical protein DPMN_011076 [Dreissena polymorpha]